MADKKPIRWNVVPGAETLMGLAAYIRDQQEILRNSFSQPSRSVQIPLQGGGLISMVLGPVVDFIQIQMPQRIVPKAAKANAEEMLIVRLDDNISDGSGSLPDPNSYSLLKLSNDLEKTLGTIPNGTIDILTSDNHRRNRSVYVGHTYTIEQSLELGEWEDSTDSSTGAYQTRNATRKVSFSKPDGSGGWVDEEMSLLLSDKIVSAERPCYHPFDPDAKPYVAKGYRYRNDQEESYVGDSLQIYGLIYVPEDSTKQQFSIGWGNIIQVREYVKRLESCGEMTVVRDGNINRFYRTLTYKSLDYTIKSFLMVNGVAYIIHEGSIKASASMMNWSGSYLIGTTEFYQPQPEYEYQVHHFSSENFRQYNTGEVAGQYGGIYPHEPFIGQGFRPQSGVRNLIGLDVQNFMNATFSNGSSGGGYIFDDNLGEGTDLMGGRYRLLDLFHARADGSFYLNSFKIFDKNETEQAIYFDDEHCSHDVARISLLMGRNKS